MLSLYCMAEPTRVAYYIMHVQYVDVMYAPIEYFVHHLTITLNKLITISQLPKIIY